MAPTLVGAPSHGAAATQVGPRTLPGIRLPRRRARRAVLMLAAAAVVAMVGLAAVLLAMGSGTASPARHQATPQVSASPTGPRLVQVSQAALAGQPVSAARQQLRQLGLQIQVRWRHSGGQQAGTVLSVQPTGRLPAGTTVVVTGALAPAGHGDRHGKGGKKHGGGNTHGG